MNEAGAADQGAVRFSLDGIGCGVSVIICCYNSSAKLPATLGRLRSQRDTEAIPWELIVVDNASSDDTVAVARQPWPTGAPAPLRGMRAPPSRRCFAPARALPGAAYSRFRS